ncbi:MAG: hypothetical protein HYZ40_18590 [Rhodospirillales bacterium]|nr:hypothetical protein [Rhodospirillales bacterium]
MPGSEEDIGDRDAYDLLMASLRTLCVALVGLAIVDLAGFRAWAQPSSNQPASVSMPVHTALSEFGFVGKWAQICATPDVVLTFDTGASPQLTIQGPKGGMRFEIRGASKVQSDLLGLELRLISVLRADKWQAPLANEAKQILFFGFAKQGNYLVSLWETQVRLGVPVGAYSKCTTLGPIGSAPPAPRMPMQPPPRP